MPSFRWFKGDRHDVDVHFVTPTGRKGCVHVRNAPQSHIDSLIGQMLSANWEPTDLIAYDGDAPDISRHHGSNLDVGP